MKKAVIIGAGNIGRGFIGQIFSEGGWEVCFLDVSETVVNALNQSHEYPLDIVSSAGTDRHILKNVRAVNGKDQESAAKEIASADILGRTIHRSRQEPQGRIVRMNCRLIQRIFSPANIQEGQCLHSGKAQRDVQIPQSDVAIDAQHLFPGLCQGCGNACTDGSFTGSALAGHHRNHFSHAHTASIIQDGFIIKQYRTKVKSEALVFFIYFITFHKVSGFPRVKIMVSFSCPIALQGSLLKYS